MSRFYRRYGAVHYQYVYFGKVTVANKRVQIHKVDGNSLEYGGDISSHDLYYAISRDYEEWDRPGNLSYDEFQKVSGLVANIPKEHKLPLEGKPKFKIEYTLEEMKRYL